MTTPIVPPKLGNKILILTDNCPACLDLLQTILPSMTNLAQTRFTLLHCCPPTYWEHGGGQQPEVAQEMQVVWETTEQEFRTTEWYFKQATQILLKAGVQEHHIDAVKDPDHDSLLDAAMAELNKHSYTGVILNARHTDLISRLEHRGITDVFRKIPDVAVWAIDEEILSHIHTTS